MGGGGGPNSSSYLDRQSFRAKEFAITRAIPHVFFARHTPRQILFGFVAGLVIPTTLFCMCTNEEVLDRQISIF
jgi:hypothetical protein